MGAIRPGLLSHAPSLKAEFNANAGELVPRGTFPGSRHLVYCRSLVLQWLLLSGCIGIAIHTMSKDKWRDDKPNSRGQSVDRARPQGADASVEKAIGNRLRAFYDEVAKEPVPDRFVDLLRRLDEQDASKG